MLNVGDRLPPFRLSDQNGQTVSPDQFAGKWLVVYTYPKDDTPGCTLEGRGFSSAKPRFDAAHCVVLGVSADDVGSHRAFCDKYSLGISLLADTKGELLSALGVGQTEYNGTLYWNRVTFVIDPHGTVRKVYAQVSVQGHEDQVLRDLKPLQSGAV